MQRTSRVQSAEFVEFGRGPQGPLIDTASFKVLDAPACYLRLILKHSGIKLNAKAKFYSQSIFRGGAPLLRPPLDPPLCCTRQTENGIDCPMVKDFAFSERSTSIQLCFTSLHRTFIFHLMQNPIPSHKL